MTDQRLSLQRVTPDSGDLVDQATDTILHQLAGETDEDTRSEIRDLVVNSIAIVAINDMQQVVAAGVAHEVEGGHFVLDALASRENERNKGIGSAVVTRIEEEIRRTEPVTLDVYPTIQSEEFYRQRGYTEVDGAFSKVID